LSNTLSLHDALPILDVFELAAPVILERNAEDINAFEGLSSGGIFASEAYKIDARSLSNKCIHSSTRSRIEWIGRESNHRHPLPCKPPATGSQPRVNVRSRFNKTS
jgi:hypothetical protein